MEDRFEIARQLTDIADKMQDLVNEARSLCRDRDEIHYPGAEAYVFEQLDEHIDNGNPYNQSLRSLATDFEDFEEPEEEEDIPLTAHRKRRRI